MCHYLSAQLPLAMVMVGLALAALTLVTLRLVRGRSKASTTRKLERPPTIVVVGETLALIMAFSVVILFLLQCIL